MKTPTGTKTTDYTQMKFLEEQFNINVALNKESEEVLKIKRA
jgi:hypothetical protein